MIKRLFKILIFIALLCPITILAKDDGISNYFIEANVKSNGDLQVKELFVLEGQFNGYERIINFQNHNAMKFNEDIKSFQSSDIYNGYDIELIKIKAIEVDKNVNFDYLYKNGDEFVEALSSSNGIYGQYVVTKNVHGESYRIYNPSTAGKRGFYIEYIIKDLAVVHNDIAEIYWNLFTNEQIENIKNLEMVVNIPNNENEIRVWGHGPLNGETNIINKNKLQYKIKDLPASRSIDIRFVFDKDVINKSLKKTNISALDKILEVENKRADETNAEREQAKKIEARKRAISYMLDIFKFFWIAALVYIIYNVYNKHDKEYQTSFKTKYFRDFPGNYGPSNVGYLINKKIGAKEISATILDLIVRKHINYEQLKKKEYQLIYNPDATDDVLTIAEQKLIKMLFQTIGKDNKVTVREINNYAKKHYQTFLSGYNDWNDAATIEAEDRNFYEVKTNVKLKAISYSIIGLLATFITFEYSNVLFINIVVIISAIGSLIYFATITKRTKEGQDHYLKWMGLNRFLKDFGKFKTRDLPQIELWEKYLVYAVVFGSAKKLAKTMEIKFSEMPESSYTVGDYLFDITYLRMLNNLNYNISQGVSSAVSTALSTKAISESSTSSGGGFGGGFSGGGGFGGGGGGGGRF